MFIQNEIKQLDPKLVGWNVSAVFCENYLLYWSQFSPGSAK